MTRDTVKIGNRNWGITYRRKLQGDMLGWCILAPKWEIQIKKKQGDIADTILHEVLHAICYDQKLKLEDEEEERIVLALATGLTRFFRDNPEYTDKLMGMIHGDN
jgi:hypothetical protein